MDFLTLDRVTVEHLPKEYGYADLYRISTSWKGETATGPSWSVAFPDQAERIVRAVEDGKALTGVYAFRMGDETIIVAQKNNIRPFSIEHDLRSLGYV